MKVMKHWRKLPVKNINQTLKTTKARYLTDKNNKGNPMSNTYESFQYLYPPRPEAKITTKTLPRYNGGAYLASPKFNGSNGVLFLPGDGTYKLYNRHGALMTLYNPLIKFEKLHRGSGWMVSNGEYMNKNK